MPSTIELTPPRLAFLHADLGFERSKIARLCAVRFSDVAESLRTHRIKRFQGAY